MTKSLNTPVSARTIRLAFAEGKFDAPDEALLSLTGHGPNGEGTGNVRGRLHPAAIEAFTAQVGGSYVPKAVKDDPTVEVPMFSVKTGRPVKPVTKTLREVRKAAGLDASRKGRISKADLHKAALAFGSGEPKVTSPKASTKAPKAAASE